MPDLGVADASPARADAVDEVSAVAAAVVEVDLARPDRLLRQRGRVGADRAAIDGNVEGDGADVGGGLFEGRPEMMLDIEEATVSLVESEEEISLSYKETEA